MKILSTAKNNVLDQKLVGVYLKTRYHSYLSLYTLAKGISKTTLLKELIIGWIEKQRKGITDQELIDMLSKKILVQWETYIRRNPYSNIDRFRIEVEAELTEKGIDPTYISLITKVLK